MQSDATEPTNSCLNCIRRLCDGAEPVCNPCIRSGLFCQWYQNTSWTPLAKSSTSFSRLDRDNFTDESSQGLNDTLSMMISNPIWLDQAFGSPGWSAQESFADGVAVDSARHIFPSIRRPLRTLSLDPAITSNSLPFIMSQYMRLIQHISFKPAPSYFQDALMVRSTASNITFWSMFLAAKVYHALFNNSQEADWKCFTRWIDQLGRQIEVALTQKLDILDMETRITVLVDLKSLKFLMAESASGYALMKRAVPLIYTVARTYPTIWTTSGKVSLSHAISMPNSDIANFVWTDNLAALVLGTTTLLCYDVSLVGDASVIGSDELEWVFGCPAVFMVLLGRVNAVRSSMILRNYSLPSHTNSNLTAEIWGWKPSIDPSIDRCAAIARLAVQECWRHALLIYLYMAVDGVESADPRVVYSARQVVQLLSTIKNEASVNRHLFVPSLIVGISAQTETQRALIRRRLASLSALKMWILQGADSVSVLDHLWHGPARDGSPIGWQDYVASRRAVIPVDELIL